MDMSQRFTKIIAEFSAEFSGLQNVARELHQLLFQHKDIFTGTDMNLAGTNQLYYGMIDAFNRTMTW